MPKTTTLEIIAAIEILKNRIAKVEQRLFSWEKTVKEVSLEFNRDMDGMCKEFYRKNIDDSGTEL